MDEYFSPAHKERADEDKPREKALSKGKNELTKAELSAILPAFPVGLNHEEFQTINPCSRNKHSDGGEFPWKNRRIYL